MRSCHRFHEIRPTFAIRTQFVLNSHFSHSHLESIATAERMRLTHVEPQPLFRYELLWGHFLEISATDLLQISVLLI